MDQDQALDIFRITGGLMEGHFLLTSGLHSAQYFQCAKVLQYPNYTEVLCENIANHFSNKEIDVVIPELDKPLWTNKWTRFPQKGF